MYRKLYRNIEPLAELRLMNEIVAASRAVLSGTRYDSAAVARLREAVAELDRADELGKRGNR